MIIDENLSFRSHVDSIKNKLLYHNYILLRVRQLLTREQMLLYYRTRVNPIIQYGVLVYGCAPFSNLQPIHRTQRIMRTIFFLPKFANVQHLMASHELPTVYELHIYEIIKLIINAICEKQSVPFLNHFLEQQSKPYSLRKTSVEHSIVPYTRYASDKQSFKFRIPLLLNKLYKWTVFPESSAIKSWTPHYQQFFCHLVLRNYIIDNQELIDAVYGLSRNK